MSLTVIVRLPGAGPENTDCDREIRLTFDGTQRVVIGRGASSDVRLPDPTVSHRHATLRAKGGEFLLVDEGSQNGTFVGGVRVASHTSRIVRSGDRVRVGRMTLELVLEQALATRDVSAATRELALALVARAMHPEDTVPRMRVVEGPDQGLALPLLETGRVYLVGRGAHCDLSIADADASREHAHVVRRGSQAYVRDLGAKNGTWLGSARCPPEGEVPWRPAQLLRIGRTVVAVEAPLSEALARIEEAPDLPLGSPGEDAALASPLGEGPSPLAPPEARTPAGLAVAPRPGAKTMTSRARSGWSPADFAVMAAAAAVLALSLAGLMWILR